MTPIDADTTRALLDKAGRGHAGAHRILIERLLPVVQARVRRYLSRQKGRRLGTYDEGDLVQEIWLVLFRHQAQQLRQWDPARGATLEGYVGMVAERELGNLRQRVGALKRRADQGAAELPEVLASAEPGPETAAVNRDICAQLGAHLSAQLSDKGQVVFRFLYTDGLGPDEVAQVMGVNRQVVYNWQHKIRQVAREFLVAAGAILGP